MKSADETQQTHITPMAYNANGKQPKRFRLQFRFWLDILKPGQDWLAEQIERLKESRMFAKAVRIGLLLYITLTEKNVSELEKHFPFIREYYRAEFAQSMENNQFQQIMNAIASRQYLPAHTGYNDLPDIDIFSGEDAVSGEEARENFTSGMGDLFGDDEDDLWS